VSEVAGHQKTLLLRRSNGSSGAEEECTFQQKVEHAMAANYSGVVVFNYKDDTLIPMGRFRQ
jgi:hypothetical protein